MNLINLKCAPKRSDIKTQSIWDANNHEPKRSDNREYI